MKNSKEQIILGVTIGNKLNCKSTLRNYVKKLHKNGGIIKALKLSK